MSCSIPIVDISSWLGDSEGWSAVQLRVAAEWNAAMREYGCAVLVGHGIASEQFDAINEECRDFFSKPLAEKHAYNHGIYGNPLGGYTAPGNEIVALSNGDSTEQTKPKFDPVENFVFTAHPSKYRSPAGEPAPFKGAVAYYEAMEALLRTVHRLSCGALGVAELDFFNKYYDPNLPGNENLGINGNALRLAHYPPINPASLHAAEDTAGAFDDKVRYGAHTDYQGFTILRPDKTDWHCLEVQAPNADGSGARTVRVQCGGLEVFHRPSNQWLQVCIPKHFNALVVNAGDLIQRWTNDYWLSPLHRVVTSRAVEGPYTTGTSTTVPAGEEADAQPASIASRQAIVFFTGPLEDCLIESLDPAVMRNVDKSQLTDHRYPPIRSGDHLRMKLDRTNLSDA